VTTELWIFFICPVEVEWRNRGIQLYMKSEEAEVRININRVLEETDLQFFNSGEDSATIQLEPNVKLKEKDIDVVGLDFEKTRNSFIDFLFPDESRFPFVVLEVECGCRMTNKIAKIWRE